jgi:PAS domain S-box-containing protein
MHIPVEVVANHMVWDGKHYEFGFVRNIAERKRAEETLLFNQRAIEQAADAVYWIARSGKIEYANAAACDMLGRTKTDLIGRNIHDDVDICISAADWPLHWEQLKQSGSLVFESRHLTHDGSIIPVETRANSILREGEEYSCVFVRDISERKRTEESMRASEAQHRNLLHNLNAGVVVHSPDTTILLNNRRALEILGLSPGQMSGKVAMDPTWRFVHEDGQTMPLEDYPVMRVRSSLEPLRDYVVGINRPLGGIAWALINAFPEFDESNGLQQIIVTFVDITARKVAETRLAEQLVEIRARHDELDRFNRAMVNRELRMLELKQEINSLLTRLGESPRYSSPHEV